MWDNIVVGAIALTVGGVFGLFVGGAGKENALMEIRAKELIIKKLIDENHALNGRYPEKNAA